MSTRTVPMMLLSELADGQEADMFVLLTRREAATTRDGRPFYKLTFRDAGREAGCPIWEDSPLQEECRAQWRPGMFFKIRGRFVESQYGPQIEIRKIRPVSDADESEGFDPLMCMPQSRFDPEEMFAELAGIVRQRIGGDALRQLVLDVLDEYREQLLVFPAAVRNHHAYAGGLIEHLLSVTRSCVYLAEKYADYYPDLQPPLDKDVVVAGAVLHDIGKLREYDLHPHGAEYSPAGHLVGHILQGRDLVREVPSSADVDPETMLRLEHVIVSHQRLPEWGSPKPTMTPEAVIVHYADDLDAKFQMMYGVLRDDLIEGPVTSSRNPLGQRVYRGPLPDDS